MDIPKDPQRWIGRKVRRDQWAGEFTITGTYGSGQPKARDCDGLEHKLHWNYLTPVGPLDCDGFPIQVGDRVEHGNIGPDTIYTVRKIVVDDPRWDVDVLLQLNSAENIQATATNLRVVKPCETRTNHLVDMERYCVPQLFYKQKQPTIIKKEKTVRTLSPQIKKSIGDPDKVLVLEELTDSDDVLRYVAPEVAALIFDFLWAEAKEQMVAAAKAAKERREKEDK